MPVLLAASPVPGDIWRQWNLDPVVVLLVALAAGLYVRGLRHASPDDRAFRVDAGAIAAWCGGLLAALIALVSPLNALTHALLTAHMAQYLVMTLVVPLLLVLGRPAAVFSRTLPATWTSGIQTRWRKSGWTQKIWSVLTLPHVAALLTLAALLLWHLPGAYQAALAQRPWWWLEQLSVLGAALLLWRSIVGASAAHPGRVLVSFFALASLETAFGLAMFSATAPWYAVYRGRTEAWGLSPHGDQQVAALLLAVVDSIPDIITLLVLVAAVLHAEERREEARTSPPGPR